MKNLDTVVSKAIITAARKKTEILKRIGICDVLHWNTRPEI